MARYPQPPRYLVGDRPVWGGIADEDVGHDISQRHCRAQNEPYVGSLKSHPFRHNNHLFGAASRI